MSTPQLLFAYGTLGPRFDPRDDWQADAVRGRLFDLGPHPVLVDLGEPEAPWTEGHVRPVTCEELEDRLDDYEGVAEGHFRREPATTRAGRLAWVYVFARDVPQYAKGPLSRWDGPSAFDRANRGAEEAHDGIGRVEGSG